MSETVKPSLPPLIPGRWRHEAFPEADLGEALRQAAAVGASEWAGIAYTTAGAKAVNGLIVEGTETVGLRPTEAGRDEINLETVYEARLWAVRDGASDGGAMADEVRWVNGSGAAHVSAWMSMAPDMPVPEDADECWLRVNEYLTHNSAGALSLENAPKISAVEVFTIEPEFGNTVFTDELMTGRWA